MPKLKALHQPAGLEEALELLHQHGDRARPLAGGTSLALSLPRGVEVLVDLRRAGLDAIVPGAGEISVGAMVTCARLGAAGHEMPLPHVLVEAAASIGSRVLQNHVTVGGNCVMLYAWSDLPVALLCLDARFRVRSKAGQRTLGAEELFASHPTRVLQPAELLVEVVVPARTVGVGSAYAKFSRNAGDQALASVAAQVALDDGRIREARLVAGAVRASPQVLAEAAERLAGQLPDRALFSSVGETAAEKLKATSDFKASGEYRRALVATLVDDALNLAVTRAGGAG